MGGAVAIVNYGYSVPAVCRQHRTWHHFELLTHVGIRNLLITAVYPQNARSMAWVAVRLDTCKGLDLIWMGQLWIKVPGPRRFSVQRRDYLMRMIEQMGVAFARIRQMLIGGEPVEDMLRLEARKSGVDLDLARVLDADSLADVLSPNGQPDVSRLWVMAELLHLDGLRLDMEGRLDEGEALHRKSLRLYLALEPAVLAALPEGAVRLHEIEERLTGR